MSAGAHGGLKKAPDPMGLDLQVAVAGSDLISALGTEVGFPRRAGGTVNS